MTGPKWSYVITDPHRVVAYSDPRNDRAMLRWLPATGTNWKREAVKVHGRGVVMRFSRGGKPLPEDVEVVKRAAAVKAAELAGLLAAAPTKDASHAFTIGEAWKAITDPDVGRYTAPSQFRDEVQRALTLAGDVWGVGLPWSSVSDDHWIMLMRRRIAQLRKDGHEGYAGAEDTILRLITVTRWLRNRKRIPHDAAHLVTDWRDELQRAWREAAGARALPMVRRPRHSEDEMRRLHEGAAAGDPRFYLLFSLAAEYRLGQARHALRSDLNLTAGTFRIRGSGEKGGALVTLTPTQRALATGMLKVAYLAELEAMREAGELKDYPLFPGGRLFYDWSLSPSVLAAVKKGRVYSREAMIRAFRDAERAAGIPHVHGRGGYGVRRGNVDGVLARGISDAGLEATGGWRGTKMPNETYKDEMNRAGREEAASIRAQVRGERDAAEVAITITLTPKPPKGKRAKKSEATDA